MTLDEPACFGGGSHPGTTLAFFPDSQEGFALSSLHEDKKIFLLELLRTHPQSGQRDMAEALGLSLGMTNLLLKELTAKGWMLMRKLNLRKVQYILTPEGLKELSKRSYRYLKKSIRYVADCRVQLETLIAGARERGASGLYLVGRSDLDFVLESLCHHQGFAFLAAAEKPQENDEKAWFVVYGEDRPETPNVLEYMHPSLASKTKIQQ
ncbi:MAG: winged helix-turn-helix transcriptional regulator [Spirochaetales bacterium]|nr:winged helix-turn-helix transcriptional regulator [Spirochaetales bacterium]